MLVAVCRRRLLLLLLPTLVLPPLLRRLLLLSGLSGGRGLRPSINPCTDPNPHRLPLHPSHSTSYLARQRQRIQRLQGQNQQIPRGGAGTGHPRVLAPRGQRGLRRLLRGRPGPPPRGGADCVGRHHRGGAPGRGEHHRSRRHGLRFRLGRRFRLAPRSRPGRRFRRGRRSRPGRQCRRARRRPPARRRPRPRRRWPIS